MAPFSLRHWSGAAVIAVVLGCAATKVALHSSQGTVTDLAPEGTPGAKAILNYNGQKITTTVIHTFANGKETLQFAAEDGEVLEQEGYIRGADSFQLSQADGDFFEPPLPLLSESAISPWSGNLVSGGIKHAAKATVTAATGKVKSQPVDLDATIVTVNLELDSGGKTPAKRVLKFSIVKGRGVVASEFGMGVKRLPAD